MMKKQLFFLLLMLPFWVSAQCDLKYINAQSLNIRQKPDKAAQVVEKKLMGESVYVDKSTLKDGFVAVKDENCTETIGYIWNGYLVDTKPVIVNSSSQGQSKNSSSYERTDGCGPAGVTLSRGPKGGCYYMSGKKKIYVDRNCCK
jgi:uncharacterized protein YgiM (DUF1202 family)